MNKKFTKQELIIKCNCGGHHYLEFLRWDDDLDLYLSMIKADYTVDFWSRLKESFMYLFKIGRETCYHEVVIEKEGIDRIKKFFNNLELNKK